MIHILAAFAVTAALLVAMLGTIPTAGAMVVAVFAIFVPLGFVGGVLGVIHALVASPAEWRHLMRGLIALGMMALAWAHFAFLSMIRNAAMAGGYSDAMRLESHTWRSASYLLLILSGLFVLRWGTRRPIVTRWRGRVGIEIAAEIPWIAVGIGWTAFVIATSDYLNRALIWIYMHVT